MEVEVLRFGGGCADGWWVVGDSGSGGWLAFLVSGDGAAAYMPFIPCLAVQHDVFLSSLGDL